MGADSLGRAIAPRTRAALSLLLTRPNAIVSIDRFVDEFWPCGPPAGARNLIHDQISRIRRALRSGPFGRAGVHAAARLVTRKPGYLLRVEEDELDRDRYEKLITKARTAADAGQLERSIAHYRKAERLW